MRAGHLAVVELQWGRHQSMSEGSRTRRAGHGSARFNGADISRCRRGAAPRDARGVRGPLASMGPTSVDVGGARVSAHRQSFHSSPLQWGRHQSMSEGGRARRADLPDPHGLQWGRHQSMSEGLIVASAPINPNGLQWGRHQSMSEGAARRSAFTLLSSWLQWGRHQSMSEGHDHRRPKRRRALGLQWGRHQSMSEGSPAPRRARAAPFRCFNGADISRCRRVKAKLFANRIISSLQWGRHQSMSEGGRCRPGASRRGCCGFNGADISRCRRASRSGARRRVRRAGFNGADISRCRRVRKDFAATPGEFMALQWGRHQSMSEGWSLGRWTGLP